MLILIDDRKVVRDAYGASFHKFGRAVEDFSPLDFCSWLDGARRSELRPVEAILIGECDDCEDLVQRICARVEAPVLVLVEAARLESTLRLYEAGVDDIVRKPVHIRELLCRIAAIQRRLARSGSKPPVNTEFHVFPDGRDPYVGGEVLELPRRERRVLEVFAANYGKRVTKEQIFHAIYGIFEEDVNECVVESHISKLRKKLRHSLGHDPIDSKRFLGYMFC